MNKFDQDSQYWRTLREFLSTFTGSSKIEKYLFNRADFEELCNNIFDDLSMERHFRSLPNELYDIRLNGIAYSDFLNYLVGRGSKIVRDAPIYDVKQRRILFSKTTKILTDLDRIIEAIEKS